ncbi:TonB-dependent receptor-like protein, partial [Salegentibacter sp. 24]|uniref:TonB-dependent receptor n=1 Tax=Salegentibacter sp. 24 TaxID=2183986 RepID=UPI0010F3818E
MRILILLLFLIFFHITFAQSDNSRVSIEVKSKTIPEILIALEKNSDYKIFFNEDWFDFTKLNGHYSGNFEKVLSDILKGTNINYFFKDDRIILTRGSLIYNRLPKGFLALGNEDNQIAKEENIKIPDPIFYSNNNLENEVIETILIGKENPGDNQNTYKISGRVMSAKGEPISGLNILVSKKNIGTVTDLHGYYQIALPKGVNIIETQALGVDKVKKRLVVYNEGKLNFELKQSFEELNEVLVNANARDNIRNALTGVEKINVAEIKTIPLVLGERDILKVATTLPGISTAGEGASGYNVRGGKTDQNLILLDGAVIYNPSHFFGIFSGLNPFTTGNVNIYKGSIPAEYGGRLSSVFDITTKNANKEKFAGEVSIGPVTGNLTLEIPIIQGKSSLIVGGRGTYSDWILNLTGEDFLQNSQASFYDGVAKYNHNFDNNDELNVTGYYSNDIFSVTSGLLIFYFHLYNDLNYRFLCLFFSWNLLYKCS